VVEANTLWVFADIATGRPVKLTEEYTKYYTLEEKLDMDYADRKIKLPEGVFGVVEKPVKIKKAFIDTNKHVNNSRYIECAAEYIPDGLRVKRIRAEYKKQARISDVFYPTVYNGVDDSGNGILCVCLNDENSKPYAVVEFDIYV
jgi:acyl-ACP thioesterase